jgi:thiamine-monophosphate kinase
MELDFIRWLVQRVSAQSAGACLIGDDAAVLPREQFRDCVVATDLLADGVHFRLSEVGPEVVGRKALAVNLSDLAAMAAKPRAAFVSLLLPEGSAAEIARRLLEGMFPLADQFQVQIAGGDTNVWRGPLVINVAVVGDADPNRVWRRSGVRPGDALVVTGRLGGSILRHHLDFVPRIAASQYLLAHYDVHAAIDLSDGLSLDAWRLAAASRCAIELDEDAVPISEDAARLAQISPQQGTAWERAMNDGEDFELLLAVSEAESRKLMLDENLGLPCSLIGRAVRGAGLWLRSSAGELREIEPRGYEH